MEARLERIGFYGSLGWLVLAGLSLVMLIESGAPAEIPEATAWTWASYGLLAIAVVVLYPLIIYVAPIPVRIPWLCLLISMVLVEGARIFVPDLFEWRLGLHGLGMFFGAFAAWRFKGIMDARGV